MGKRKRGRCVKKNTNANLEPEELTQAPHSFVIHKGLPGGNILDLTKDFRKVMEPFTASSLRERKKNAIKDFVSVAGLLHVTHLCVFSRTELGAYLKIGRLPRGPTLSFKIHNFSLARDVVSSLKKQLVVEEAFKHSPLIVLNSFSGEGMQMKLMASTFQNMFPTINLNDVNLNTVRRCVLLNYNPATKLIDFRHYNIKVIPAGVSKGVKKVIQGKVPNLARCNDISDFLTNAGMLSESEFEDDPNSHVTVSQKLTSRGNIELGKSAIKLSELGPRLSLQLIKIEDGLMDGEVLYHDLVHKTEEEKAEIKMKRDMKKKLKAKRKNIQEENRKNKEAKKEELKEKSLEGMQKKGAESEIKSILKSSESAIPDDEDDDAEHYRQEVGEEPSEDLFSKTQYGGKRPPKTFHSFKNKRPRLDQSSDRGNRSFDRGNKSFDRGNRSSDRGDKKGRFDGGDKRLGGKKFGGGKRFDGGENKSGGRKFGGKKFDGKKFDGKKFDGKKFDGKKFGGKKFDGKKFDGKKFGGRKSDNSNRFKRK